METLKAVPFIVLVFILGFAVYNGKKPLPQKVDQTPLTVTDRTFHGLEVNDDTSKADIEATCNKCGSKFGVSIFDDGVYQTKEQAANGSHTYKYIIHYKPVEVGLDLGWWGGIESFHRPEDNPVDMGLRISPCRLAWGVLALDGLIGTQSLGIGVSAYAPTGTVNGFWKKIGIGGAWMAGYHGGGGWVPYLSVTTTF